MSSLSLDEMEAIQEDLELTERERGRGPRRKKKHKNRESDSKTSREAREESRKNAQENRLEVAKKHIAKFVSEHFSKKFKENEEAARLAVLEYSKWVANSLYVLVLDFDKGVTETAVRGSSGPGGQNVNKVSSGIHLVHSMSGIASESVGNRSQLENREVARESLREHLETHLDNWKTVYKSNGYVNTSDFSSVVEEMCLDILGMDGDEKGNENEKEKEASLDYLN